MDIFEFAMEKEKYSEQFYRDLAGKTTHQGFKNILTMLAGEEAKHYRTIQQMRTENPQQITDTPVLARAREVFEKMRGSADKFTFPADEAELYRKACDIEDESRKFYLEKAEQTDNPAHKDVFQRLAAEENKHWIIVDRIRSFVARPQTFLENAEMYHFGDYVGGEF
jgi:rubrerythrin